MQNQRLLSRANTILLFLFLFFGALVIGKPFFIPLSFAILISMLILPVVQWLNRRGIGNGWSIFISLILVILIMGGLIFLFSYQLSTFANDFSKMRLQFEKKVDILQGWIQGRFHVEPEKQMNYLRGKIGQTADQAAGVATDFVIATTGTLFNVASVFIYVFFILLYRGKLKKFILRVTPPENHKKAEVILSETSSVTQRYLTGVIIVISILSVMNSIGLLIVGLEHAIFFGILAAILNIVPYVGVLIGSSFAILYTLFTHDSFGEAVAVAIVFMINQFIENNFLTPNIVGSKVQLNPLAAIFALVIGGFIWGIAGMIIFIPFLGIVKIIFSRIDSLNSLSILIEDEEDEKEASLKKKKLLNIIQLIKRKKK